MKVDATFVLEELNRHGFQTWGLVICRACYYDDDLMWEQFLERMKEFARRILLGSVLCKGWSRWRGNLG
jgi:hypothetical protein